LPQVWLWIEAISAVRHVLLLHSRDDGEDTSEEQALGRGTFGQCFRVTDSCTREVFCLKAPASAPTDTVAVRALRKEAQVMRRLSHPNVLRSVALISSEDNLMQGLLLPLADCNLWTWIGSEACPSNHGGGADVPSLRQHCGQILAQVARGLSYLHVSRVIHLDMKPENLLLSETGLDAAPCVHIADFGSCRPGPDAQGKGGEHLRADLVNAEVYRPLHLFLPNL
jgi:serine/threonine protein kinase